MAKDTKKKGGGKKGDAPDAPLAGPSRLRTKYNTEVRAAVAEKFGIKNPMAQPRLEKITINVNMGRHLDGTKIPPNVKETILDTLTTITGQKPVVLKAKKSVSNFKVRAGFETAAMVTIRRDRMWHFLDRLINQQLARQKAIEAQLDRSPEVVQAIEAAKTEILARAHVDGINRTLLKPAPLEIQKYYSSHPELFAQRRIFALEEIAFTASEDLAGGIRAFLSKPRSMKEIADWLQSKGVAFSANRGVRAAEQIPLVMLPKLQAMTKGEIQPFEAMPGRYQVIRVVDFLEAPMDEATAAPRIERFLFNQVSGAAVAREMNEIRKQAKIEYLGEFAERAAAPEAKKGEAEVKSFSEAEAKAEADAQARSQDSAGKQGQK